MRRVFGIALVLSVVLALTGCGPKAPDLKGMTRGDAEKAIAAAGLTRGDLAYDAGSTAPTGTVVAQRPEAGKRISDGSSIALTLAGPAPVAAPSLRGLDTTRAAEALSAAGLKLGTVIESYSATIPAGVLISQKPVPGVNTPKGSTIDLVVSKGPEPVAIPNVIKKSEADARKLLVAAGFKVVVSKKADKATKGTVITQKPSGGKAQPGTSVTLTVSEGILSPQAKLLGTWKSSDGSTYMFRPANRVKVPSGGVVRYRISGSTLQIYYPVGPLLGTIAWVSSDQFKLTVDAKVTTYKRVR